MNAVANFVTPSIKVPKVPAIELSNLKKKFGSKVVLNGLDLRVQRGETLVVLGPSGTGKSVLLKCILGLMMPDSGEITVSGLSVKNLTEKAHTELMQRIGMLFQGGALFDSLSVWENVSFVELFVAKMAPKLAREKAIENLAMVGLGAEVALQNPADLSGGMRKRVALARAISRRPEIIFYDEPTTGLDPVTSDVISTLIRKLQTELHCTSVVITHDLACAFKTADRLAFLQGGRVAVEGTAAEFRASADPALRRFIAGDSTDSDA